MPKNVIQRSFRLYQRKKYTEAIQLLESQIFRFRDRFEFYSLLGLACLYSGDFGGAESYLKRASQLKSDDTPILLGLAALDLKRFETEGALKKWLKVINLDPRNRTAGRGLNFLRRDPASADIQELIESGRIKSFFPPIPFSVSRFAAPALAVFLTALIILGLVYFFSLSPLPFRRDVRPGIREIELSTLRLALTEDTGSSGFMLSEEEIRKTFSGVKTYLMKYRDNLALREINKILLSNASAYVKEKSRLLKTFVQVPDFTTIKDSFSFLEVQENPLLYEGCFVVWAGKAANVNITEEKITFDLLVGYQYEKELQGFVPVTLDFAVNLESGFAVEILGQVVSSDTLGRVVSSDPKGRVSVEEKAISLIGISIHRLLEK